MVVINCQSVEAMKRNFIDSRQVSFMDVDSLTTPNDISFESLLGLRYTAAHNTSSMHRFCCVFLIIISENGILVWGCSNEALWGQLGVSYEWNLHLRLSISPVSAVPAASKLRNVLGYKTNADYVYKNTM